jgi:hypothetical protein
MKPDRKAQLATVVLVGALGCVAIWKRTPSQASTPEQPQDAIYQMFDAVREGNLPKYLEAHTGVMEASLRSTAAEIGEAALLKSLQEKNAPVKGIAILEPVRVSDREMKARVEYVFADRNEVQIVYLERIEERWKIARVEGAQRIETLMPYGSPVN